MLLQVGPDGLALVLGLIGADHAQKDAADAHHHGQVVLHVALQALLGHAARQRHRVDHDARDAQLLVDAAHHDRFVDRLVLAADEVAVHVHVQVVNGFDLRQGHVYEDVVHVEGVLGKLKAHAPQHLGAVDDRMHEQILARAEMPHFCPGELAAFGEDVAVMHDGARVLMHLFVDVVGHHQIGGVIAPCLRAHVGHDVLHGAAIEPVVGVDHLEVQAGRVGKAGVDRLAMPAVFLVNGLDDARVAFLPRVGFFSRVVLGRAVVDDDDLDVVEAGLPAASQQRFYAFVHVFRGVVTRNGERDGFHACPSRRCAHAAFADACRA